MTNSPIDSQLFSELITKSLLSVSTIFPLYRASIVSVYSPLTKLLLLKLDETVSYTFLIDVVLFNTVISKASTKFKLFHSEIIESFPILTINLSINLEGSVMVTEPKEVLV